MISEASSKYEFEGIARIYARTREVENSIERTRYPDIMTPETISSFKRLLREQRHLRRELVVASKRFHEATIREAESTQ